MPKALTLTEAVELMIEGKTSIIAIPLFLTTDTEKFKEAVINRCKQALKTPELTRVFLFMQEGISNKKARRIWAEVQRQDETLENEDYTDRLQVYSFGNVPTDIIRAIFKNSNIEIV